MESLRRCVYTTLLDGNEELDEQPMAGRSTIPFICVTNDRNLKSNGWEVRQVPIIFGMDPIRSQMDIKIRPHLHLPDFDQSLYIDNTVLLSETPEGLFAQYSDIPGFCLPHHSYHDTVLDEFLEIADDDGFDDQYRIFEQLNHYAFDSAETLQEKPYWTGILLRDHRNSAVRNMLETWAAHVFRYSGRDQLSINLAFRQSGLTPQVLETDDFSSWFHSRLAASLPDHRKRTRQSVNALGLSIVRVRQAEQSLGEQGRNHQAALDELKRYGAAQLRALDEEILSLNGALEQQQALNVEKDAVIVTKDVLIAEQREQISRAEDLLADQDARLSENGRLLADRSNHVSRLQSEVEKLSATIDESERTIGYISDRYTKILEKQFFRRFRHALKVRYFGLSVPTSRYSLIRNSVFFDKNFYLTSNPEVKSKRFDPVVHYLQYGGKEGRDPGPHFSEAGYRALSPDVAVTSLSALEHYESHGRNQGRRLLAAGPGQATATTTAPDPIVLRQSFERSGLFDPIAYLGMHEDLRLTGADPWTHFLTDGLRDGRQFTTPELVARALSRLTPDVENALLDVNERLSDHAGEQEMQRAAEPLVTAGVAVAVYCSSLGSILAQEIANLVNWQLKALGINSQLRAEDSDIGEAFSIRIFVAPHEFFWLGRGKMWSSLAAQPGSVLFNVEQAPTRALAAAINYLICAPLVLDLDFQTALLCRQLGCKSIHYMPPHLPASPYTVPQQNASHIELLRGYDFSRKAFDWTQHAGLADRPIDILFIGSAYKRRVKAIEGLRVLTDKYRFVCVYIHQTTPLTGGKYRTTSSEINCALAQRAKIVLSIHRDWIGYFEWSSMVMQGFWQGACVVSDPGLPDPFFRSGVHFLEEAIPQLPELLHWLLGTPEGETKMSEVAAAGHRQAISPRARAAMVLPTLTALREVASGTRI
jgi:hypothetical protein